MNEAYLSDDEVQALSLAAVGTNVKVHRSCVLVGVANLQLGHNVRIDPFCVITATGSVSVSDHVHIGAHCSLVGAAGITIGAFASISHGARLFSESDDLSESALIGSQAPRERRAILSGPIVIGAHACIGAGSIVLPGVVVGEGAVTGAFSLVREGLAPWSVNAGAPSRIVGVRDGDRVRALARDLSSDRSS